MNFLLEFTQRDVRNGFYRDNEVQLTHVRNIAVVGLIFKIIIYSIAASIIDQTTLRSQGMTLLRSTGLLLITIIVLTLIMYFNGRARKKCLKIGKWTFLIYDLFAGGLLFFMFAIKHAIDDSSDTLSELSLEEIFVGGLMLMVDLYIYSHCLSFWMIKASFISSVLLYYIIKTYELYHEQMFLLRTLLNVIVVVCVIYLDERKIKTIYLKKETARQHSQVWKEILDDYPEGVLIVGKDGKLHYSNKSLKNVLEQPETPNASRENILQSLEKFAKVSYSSFKDSFEAITKQSKEKKLTLAKSKSKVNQGMPTNFTRSSDVMNLKQILDCIIEDWSSFQKLFVSSEGEKIHSLVAVEASLDDGESSGFNRTFQIKISVTNFSQAPALILMFTETTQLKLIAMLKDQDEYKSKVLASVSHELRTPLNGSLNFLQIALDDARLPEEIKEKALIPTQRSCLLLLNLINDILDFSRMQCNKLRLSFEKKNLIETINQAIELVEIQAKKKGLSLSLEIDNEINDSFSTDHSRLKQILLNLLSNAVKFTCRGGIAVIVQKVPTDSTSAQRVRIAVQDTGVGISEADQKMLFKEFSQVGQEQQQKALNPQGVGLGLIISYRLAWLLSPPEPEKSGIEVVSEVDKGSAFSFTIEEKSAEDEKQTLGIFEGHSISRPRFILNKDSNASINVSNFRVEVGEDTPIMKSRFDSKRHQDDETMIIKSPVNESMSITSIGIEAKAILTDQYLLQPMTQRAFDLKNELFSRTLNTCKGSAKVMSPKSLSCSCAKILVVDDDMYNILAYETLFEKLEMQVDTAFNGRSAIETVLQKNEGLARQFCMVCENQYYIIFMDLQMPLMSGFDASKRLKGMMSHGEIPLCPIIGCSAYTEDEELKRKVRDAEMDGLCTKPLTKHSLMKVLQKHALKLLLTHTVENEEA